MFLPGSGHLGLESHRVRHKGERNEVAVSIIIILWRRVKSLVNISARSCTRRFYIIHSLPARKSAIFITTEENIKVNFLEANKLGRGIRIWT